MSAEPAIHETDVLILGGGFAGVWCARRLERLLDRQASICLVSAENYFVFQPLLPEVLGASLDPAHVISPLRHLLRRTAVVRGEVSGIDRRERVVEVSVQGTAVRHRFRGRHLVLALGSAVDVGRLPGMAEHALLMKNMADALALRRALMEKLERAVLEEDPEERARLLTIAVVGGGFSGVETAAEILDLLRHAQRFYPQLHGESIRVVCIHRGDRLIPELPAKLGVFAQRNLERRGMEVRLQTTVRAASGEAVYLENGESIPTRTVVCTIGNAPHPVLRETSWPMERDRIATEPCLRVRGEQNVWAIGDCSRTSDGRGGFSAPTAQFAVRQGDVAARNIHKVIEGREPEEFSYRSQGQLASLGHRNAVAYVGGLRLSGFFAWWLWRTIYLLKLPRLDRKLQVVIDWTLRLFFPRDLNFVDVQPTLAVSRIHLEQDEVLFRQGDPSGAFYVIESGSVVLTQVDEAGKAVLREELGSGDHFGEGSLLNHRQRTTTATTMAAATVLVLDSRLFHRLTDHWTLLRQSLDTTARRFALPGSSPPADLPAEVLHKAVDELMSQPVVTLPQDASLLSGLQRFTEHAFSSLPLVDADGKLVALATRTDLYRARQRDLPLEQPLLPICTSHVRSLRTGEPVGRAVELMHRHGVKHVPILDGEDRVIGMVSFRDVLRELMKQTAVEGA